MTVDLARLPTLKVLQSYGDAVIAARMGINAWDAKDRKLFPLYGIYFLPLVKEFQKAHGIPATGTVGPRTWSELIRFIPPKGRLLLPQKRYVPNLGPTTPGGKSVLAQDCTHATAGIPLYPAFDDAFRQGATIIAPEDLVVTRSSSSSPGLAFYATGSSKLRYWFGHLDRTHQPTTKFRIGDAIGRVARNTIGGGPHCHVGVNVELVWGRGKQLQHRTNYTHGAPTIGAQLAKGEL